MNPNDDENVKPVSAGDDFSDDTQHDDVNPDDAPLDAGIDPSYQDQDEETIPADDAQDNPLGTESAIDEVDDKLFPAEKQNLGDVVFDPLDLEEDTEDEESDIEE